MDHTDIPSGAQDGPPSVDDIAREQAPSSEIASQPGGTAARRSLRRLFLARVALILFALTLLGAAVGGLATARHFYIRSKVAMAEPVRLDVYQEANRRLLAEERGGINDRPPRVVLIGDSAIRSEADIVICGALLAASADVIGCPKVRFGQRQIFTNELLDRFCRLGFGSGVLWNKLYRTEIIGPHAGILLERDVDASEDYIVNVGCFARARVVVTLPNMHYFYFVRECSASRSGTNAASFARVLAAYAACIATYVDSLSAGQLDLVDELYSRQLTFDCYRVASARELEPHHDLLRSGLRKLADIRPNAVYRLIHAFDVERSRPTLGGIIRELKSDLHQWFVRKRRRN